MKLKQILVATLCTVMLTGCGNTAPEPTPVPMQTTVPNAAVETTLPIETIPVEPTLQTEDALSRLRGDLKPPVAATGYLGYWSANSSEEPGTFVREAFPNYWASNSYLSEITDVYGEYGVLYCVVPRLPETEVTVNLVQYGDYPYGHLTNLDRRTGEPFWVLSMLERDDAMLEIIFTEPDGRTLVWYPIWGECHCEGTGLTAESLLVDFTIYDDPDQSDTAGSDGALVRLRDEMEAPLFAVATLAYWEPNHSESYRDYLMETYPVFWGENEYLHTITDSYGSYGSVYCVVPGREDLTVTVNTVSCDGVFPYQVEVAGESHANADPFFVLSEIEAGLMLEVVITAPDGERVYWYPSWNETQGDTSLLSPKTMLADFTPPSEMTARQTRLANGWYIPDFSEMETGCWLSYNFAYALDLLPEGQAVIYDVDYDGAYTKGYFGTWSYEDGYLTLQMQAVSGDGGFEGSFPVLLDPYGYGDIWLGRADDGKAVPYFPDNIDGDDLSRTVG